MCAITFEPPVFLTPENRRVWNMYDDIIGLSRADSRGLPTLDGIGFYFDRMISQEYSRNQFDLMMMKLLNLHSMVRESLMQRIKDETETDG